MGFGNFLVVILISVYTKYFFSLIFSNKRSDVRLLNDKLETLRRIPVKSTEEQKEFINLRYPKTDPYKFKWKDVPRFVGFFVLYGLMFFGFNKLLTYLGVDFSILNAIFLVCIVPIIINFVLKKFGLHKQDTLSNMFRFGGNKK